MANKYTPEQITANLRARASKGQSSLFNNPDVLNPNPQKTDSGLQILRPIEYTTRIDSIYDRKSDGSYIARYENYLGNTGNEDRLARQQSAGEQWAHGLSKMFLKAGNYAIDSVVGTAYGIGKGLFSGDFSDIYDNEFTNWMDDVNKSLDYKLVNYYSDEEKSQGFLKNMLTANFWANDVGGGLAFVGGAVLPSIALGALSGGATLGATLGRTGLKLAGSIAKETSEAALKRSILGKVADISGFTKGRNVSKQFLAARLGKKTGDVASNALFLARSANFEAGMEARHSFREATDNFYNNYYEQNGTMPSYEETQSFLEDARKASNGVYGANMAILTVSNAVMFGKKIMPEYISKNLLKPATNFGNKLIGLGVKTEVVEGKVVGKLLQANKAQKVAGNAYKILRKPLTEGLYEEGFQGVATKTMQGYLEAKYDKDNIDGYSVWSSMHEAFTEQYSSDEGWKEMGIGIIIGFLGGAVNPQAYKSKAVFEGFGATSLKSRRAEIEKGLTRSNAGFETLAGMNRLSAVTSFGAAKESGQDSPMFSTLENEVGNFNFIRSQEHVKTTKEIKDDHHRAIDSMDMSKDIEMLEAFEKAGITEAEYKAELKAEFETSLKRYNSAKKNVEAIGLNSVELEPGNKVEIAESMMFNMMVGESSLSSAKQAMENLDSLIGTNGIYDHVRFYDELTEEGKTQYDQLKKAKRRLNDLTKQHRDIGQRMSGVEVEGQRKFKPETLKRRRERVSEEAVRVQTAITETNEEIERLTGVLSKYKVFSEAKYKEGEYESIGSKYNVLSSLEEVDKLDDLLDTLETNGNARDAQQIRYLLEQYKLFSNVHRESINSYRSMLDSNFFSSKEGKTFLDKVVGKKYTMSQDFKDEILANNEQISQSLERMGITGYETVTAKIEEVLEKNKDLSEREKFRMESVLRMQLTTQIIQDKVDTINATFQKENVEKEEGLSPLEGDTVRLVSGIMTEEDKISREEELVEQRAVVEASVTKLSQEVEDLKESLKEDTDIGVRRGILSKYQEVRDLLKTENKKLKKLDSELKYIRTSINPTIATLDEVISVITEQLDAILGESKTKEEDLEGFIKELEEVEKERARLLSEAPIQLEALEEVSEEEFEDFVDAGNVSDARLRAIAKKVLEGESLTEKEQAIFTDKTQEVESIVKEYSEFNREGLDALSSRADVLRGLIDKAHQSDRIISKGDYKRLSELTAKKVSGELSKEEAEELEELAKEIDKWMFITGVIAEGYRLSDLVRQKAILENTPVTEVESVEEVSPQEAVDSLNFGDKPTGQQYDKAQHYDSVVVSITKNKENPDENSYKISGISYEALSQEAGVEFEYEVDEQNNLVVSEEVRKQINDAGKVAIVPTNKNLLTNYSVVLKATSEVKEDGTVEMGPLKSTHNEDFDGVSQDTAAVYAQNEGDTVELEVNPEDTHNKKLLEDYRQATEPKKVSEEELDEAAKKDTPSINNSFKLEKLKRQLKEAKGEAKVAVRAKIKRLEEAMELRRNLLRTKLSQKVDTKKIEEAKEALRKGLVIRVKGEKTSSGSFLSVLKGKRRGKDTEAARRFENMRDAFVNEPGFLEMLLAGVPTDVSIEGEKPVVKVSKVFMGHPNFNFVRNEDGSVSIDYKAFTEQDLKKVEAIGYLHKGDARNNKGLQGVDMSFMKAFMDKSNNSKLPFIVVKLGEKFIAYPVRMEAKPKLSNEEFISVFNSNLDTVEKVEKLNTVLAQRGVDIKLKGNAFNLLDDSTLTQEFFEEKLAQLDGIDYFYTVEEWVSKPEAQNEILKEQARLNINLSEPFHSPKLKLDYTEVKNIPVTESEELGEKVSKTKVKKASNPKKSALLSVLNQSILNTKSAAKNCK